MAHPPLLNPYLDLFNAFQKERDLSGIRKRLIWAYAWAIPSPEAIWALTRLSPLVELGAGTGYWAWLLRQAGARIDALEHEPGQPPWWTRIDRGIPHDLVRYHEHTLLLCWPPLDEPMAAQALRAHPGHRVAYIGEWRGRTADSAFHDLLELEFDREAEIEIPCWPGFRDRLFIFHRKRERQGESPPPAASTLPKSSP